MSKSKTGSSPERSKDGIKAVGFALLVLAMAAAVQSIIYFRSHSMALLADVIHNFGDSLTAVPLALAFFFRSSRGERWAGYFVISTIVVSAAIVTVEAISRLIHPQNPTHLWALAAAGLVGAAGNEIAGIIRRNTGKRINSPALEADGNHARIDGLVSLSVVLSAGVLALGWKYVDPLIGLLIVIPILHITWESWQKMQGD